MSSMATNKEETVCKMNGCAIGSN